MKGTTFDGEMCWWRRQSTKLLALDPGKVLPLGTATGGIVPMHPTATAWVAWRYLQLLTGEAYSLIAF